MPVRVLPGGDHGADALDADHQPLGGQDGERIPDRVAGGAESLGQARLGRQQAVRESALQHLAAKNVRYLPGPVGSAAARVSQNLRRCRDAGGAWGRHETKPYLSDPKRGICRALRHPADR
jgi:hypothetical protein